MGLVGSAFLYIGEADIFPIPKGGIFARGAVSQVGREPMDREKRFRAILLYLEIFKKSFIRVLSSYGKKHPLLTTPVFLLTVLFIFFFNVFLQILKFAHMVLPAIRAVGREFKLAGKTVIDGLRVIKRGLNDPDSRERRARVVAAAMAVVMIVTGVDGLHTSVAYGSDESVVYEMDAADDSDENSAALSQDETTEEASDESDDETSAEESTDDLTNSDRDIEDAEDDRDTSSVDERDIDGESSDEESQDVDGSDPDSDVDTAEGEDEESPDDNAGKTTGFFMSYITYDGIRVTVEADEGVFPDESNLYVREATEREVDDADEAVEEIRDTERNTVISYTYDIKVLDLEGNEIEPNTEAGDVRVYFSMDEVTNENLQADIYHIKEDEYDSTLTAEKLLAELAMVEDEEMVTAKTNGFSLYTVEFTYGSLQYVMEGDTEVKLSDILEEVGLSGTVTSAEGDADELFTVYKNEEDVWMVRALQAFDTEQTLWVEIDGVTYEILVTDDNSGDENYSVLLWVYGSTASSYSSKLRQVFSDAGISVGTVYTQQNLTADMVKNVQLIYLCYMDNQVASGSGVETENNISILKDYVNNGGRIVMQSEHPQMSSGANDSLSALGHEIGANFTFVNDILSGEWDAELNDETDLSAGIAEIGTLKPYAVSYIATYGDAFWVARAKGNGSKYYNFVVDQAAGKGRLTAISDVSFIINYSGDNPHYQAVVQLFKNLVLDSVENIKRVNANPQIDTDNITMLQTESGVYYRLLDEKKHPITADYNGVDGKEVTAYYDGEKLSITKNGWIEGKGDKHDTDKIRIDGLTFDTKYFLQTVAKEYYDSEEEDVKADNNKEPYVTTKYFYTLIDPLDSRNDAQTKESYKNNIKGKAFIYRNDTDADSQEGKDTITISNILHWDSSDPESYTFALKTVGGKRVAQGNASKDGEKTTGIVKFTNLDPQKTYYLVAFRSVNSGSASVTIPCVKFSKSWYENDGEEQSIEEKDIEVYAESKLLEDSVHYSMVKPDLKTDRENNAGSSDFEKSLPDNVLSGTEKGSYTFSLKYLPESEYEDACYITRSWSIQDKSLKPTFTPTPSSTPYIGNGDGGEKPGGGTGGGGGSNPPAPPQPADTATPAPTAGPRSARTEIIYYDGMFIRTVRAPLLERFTEEQQENNIEVRLTVTEEEEADIDADLFQEMSGTIVNYYKNYEKRKLGTDIKTVYNDMTVTKKVGDEEPVKISDVNRVLEIQAECDLSDKYNPVVVREHGGKVAAFTELSARPSSESNYKDGTFYVDDEGNIWIYARYFSKYTIAYLTREAAASGTDDGSGASPDSTPSPTPKKTKNNDATSPSDNTKKKTKTTVNGVVVRITDHTGSGGSSRPGHVPETGDTVPISLLWTLMIGTGVVILSYLVGGRKKRG